MSLKLVLLFGLALGCQTAFTSSASGQCGTQYRLLKEKKIEKKESSDPAYQLIEKVVKQTITIQVAGAYFGALTRDLYMSFMQVVSGKYYLRLGIDMVWRSTKVFRVRTEDPLVLILDDDRKVEVYPVADDVAIYEISEKQLAMLPGERVAAVNLYVLYLGRRDVEAAGKKVERDAQGRDYVPYKMTRGNQRNIIPRLAGCIAGVKKSDLRTHTHKKDLRPGR